ncbi:MAG: hypothetical protein AB8H47_18530 [Bacteroidia bacterium]
MRNFFPILLAILFLSACQPDPVLEPDLLNNNDFEASDNDYSGWFANNSAGTVAISRQESRSGKQSILLSSLASGNNFSFIAQEFSTFEVERKLKLSAYIKLKEVEGEGLSIVVRGDTPLPNVNAEWFYTTQGKVQISGTHKWTEYTLITDDIIPANITRLTVYVVYLANTSGSAWVDDISLDYVD